MSTIVGTVVAILVIAVLIENTLIGKILVEIVGVAGGGYLLCFWLLACLGAGHKLQWIIYVIILALLVIDVFHRIQDGC